MPDLELGTFTAFPYTMVERDTLPPYSNDELGRVLVKPSDPSVTRAERWTRTTDQLSGLRIEMRRADCGAGCKCATEVRILGAPPAAAAPEQPEPAVSNVVRFTVEFDSLLWESMLEEQRRQWVAIVEDAINAEAHITLTERDPKLRLEILHKRDPDAGCEHTVFVDGAETEAATIEDVDPGAGYERSDWDERIAEVSESYSPAFRQATLDALQAASGSEYITEGDDWRYVQ